MSVERQTWACALPGGRSHAVDVAIHRAGVGRLVVMIPGWDGDIDGYADKYVKIAELLVARGVAAVVRMGNHPVPELGFEVSSPSILRAVVARALSEARAICGSERPELYGMGMSAGAGAWAVCAGEAGPALRKLLLLAPSSDCEPDHMRAGLAGYEGELRVTVGDADLVVGRRFPEEVSRMAPRAALADLVVVPGCDHQFRGERNGRILSQAPLWAFAGDVPYPDPARGIHLYD